MTKSVLLPAVLLAAVLCAPASAESQRIAIATSQIADAMTQAGFATLPDQVTLLANVVATTPNPILKVDSVDRSESVRMKARLSCKDARSMLAVLCLHS